MTSGPSFNGIGPFDPADMPWKERWDRIGWLEQACRGETGTEPALHILRWHPHTAKRRDEAQMILNGLPALTVRHILAKYGRIAFQKKRSAA